MRVVIGAPNMGLSVNERRGLELIGQGKEPREIAKIMHLAYGTTYMVGCDKHGITLDTVINLITSLRNKGYDIPKIKEDKFMEKVRRTPEEKAAIIAAYRDGKSLGQIAQELNIPKPTIYSIVKAWEAHGDSSLQAEEPAPIEDVTEKEPAEEAAPTSSALQENINIIDVDTSIAQNDDAVKTLVPQAVIEACWERLEVLREQIDSTQAVIDDWKAQLADINGFLELTKGLSI